VKTCKFAGFSLITLDLDNISLKEKIKMASAVAPMGIIVTLLLFVIAIMLLYHVIRFAINNSKLTTELRNIRNEIKEMKEAFEKSQS
jgi:cell division protein FtsX